jgi:hypothetical protein
MDDDFSDIFIGETLVIVLLFLLVAGALTLLRLIQTAAEKTSAREVIKAIRKDPSTARNFSKSLDVPYSRKEGFSPKQFDELKVFMKSAKSVGQYRIVYLSSYDINHQIAFTELIYVDLHIDKDGNEYEKRRKAYHNFLLTFDRENSVLSIWSDVFTDIQSKFQKQDFMNEVLKHISMAWTPKV